MYIYKLPEWPHFHWRESELVAPLAAVRHLQGRIVGRMEAMGFNLQSEASLFTFTQDVLRTSEIEGELLNPEQVRSSVARKLGMDISGLIPSDRNVDGVVEMTLDATLKCGEPLTAARLFDWHAALFPTGRNGMYAIKVADWRDDAQGPMYVVSGPFGSEKVHFTAPSADVIPQEMEIFLTWFNAENRVDPVIKAAIAHLWFVTLHPFDDGNGRIARAIADLMLARADGITQRFYSMTAQIRTERNRYYDALKQAQQGTLDITDWLVWFLQCMHKSLLVADTTLSKILAKHRFWTIHAQLPMNSRQVLLLGRLLDGFEGKMNTSKWGKIAKCSTDTALRDIQDLIHKGVLMQEEGGGRSTSYALVPW